METYLTQAINGRGCGHRDEDMPYLCTGLSTFGLPIEDFIIDPPILLEGYQPSRSLYSIIEVHGIKHVLIIVGYQHYPSPWSFIEEARLYGVSRKVKPSFPFHILTEQSQMYFAHSKLVLPKLDKNYIEFHNWPDNCQHGHDTSYKTHPDGSPCTFANRNMSSVLTPNCVYENGVKVPFGNRDKPLYFGIDLPSEIQFNEKLYVFPHNNSEEGYEAVGDRFFKSHKLTLTSTATTPYIFLRLPITHIEARNSLSEDVKAKLNKLNYPYYILDY